MNEVLTANIKEVFSSIQGEGPYIGCRQVFVRFSGCNLSCKYCDTDFSEGNFFQVEKVSGSNELTNISNPISSHDLVALIDAFGLGKHHSISFTGGEPLIHCEFLKSIIPLLDAKIYLETNGTLVDELKTISELLDIISMDVKLPSSSGCRNFYDEHLSFIEVAKRSNIDVFAKAVVSSKVTESELDFLAEISKEVPVVIQPITTDIDSLALKIKDLFWVVDKVPNARVIPQTHNYMGLL